MKISVIMQVYLGDYPHSRSLPKLKFVRAVNSFLNQTHNDKELIIVSDNCYITDKIYRLLYENEKEIKYIFVNRDEKDDFGKMYETTNDNKTITYRGICRQKGIEISTGDIITYLDSDDIILPNHLNSIHQQCLVSPTRIDKPKSNILRLLPKDFASYKMYNENTRVLPSKNIDLSNYGIHEPFVINLTVTFEQLFSGSYGMIHGRNIDAKWSNCQVEYNPIAQKGFNSEDHLFAIKLFSSSNCYIDNTIYSPTYVVCHYKYAWDL